MDPSGFLLIDKPAGITSHDVIDAVRRVTGIRRVGHAGTLDPFATGLLIVGVGKDATTRLSELVGLDKTYEATFVLGATSTTDDPEGVISPLLSKEGVGVVGVLNQDRVESAMQTFVGTIDQIPPQYAAIKIQGKKMYELAREGKTIEAKPRSVRIDELRLLSPSSFPPISVFPFSFQVRIRCSSGTYIRAIARDLGAKLGVGGYVSQLRRTAIGSFTIDQAVTLDELQKQDWKTLLFHPPKTGP